MHLKRYLQYKSTITINIPGSLIKSITKVTMGDDRAQERVIDAKFNDSNPKYIAVTIGLGSMAPNGNIKLTMTGNAGYP